MTRTIELGPLSITDYGDDTDEFHLKIETRRGNVVIAETPGPEDHLTVELAEQGSQKQLTFDAEDFAMFSASENGQDRGVDPEAVAQAVRDQAPSAQDEASGGAGDTEEAPGLSDPGGDSTPTDQPSPPPADAGARTDTSEQAPSREPETQPAGTREAPLGDGGDSDSGSSGGTTPEPSESPDSPPVPAAPGTEAELSATEPGQSDGGENGPETDGEADGQAEGADAESFM
jgi:hypothetical protein